MVLLCHLFPTNRPKQILKILLSSRMIFLTQYSQYEPSVYVETLCMGSASSSPSLEALEMV